MALELDEHEDVVFGRAPLVSVLSQVKFSPILALLAPAGVAGFQAAIRLDYPNALGGEQATNIELNPGGIGVNQTAPTWRFQDESGRWTVGISTDFVSIETPTYTSIDEFLGRFARVLHAAQKTLRPSASTRIGMRKVNAFPLKEFSGSAVAPIFRREFLGVLAVDAIGPKTRASNSHFEITDDDNVLTVNSGFAMNAADNSLAFLLDMDYWTERPYQVSGEQTMMDLLHHFSAGMTDFFHWVVTDEYKRQLDPHPRTKERVEG